MKNEMSSSLKDQFTFKLLVIYSPHVIQNVYVFPFFSQKEMNVFDGNIQVCIHTVSFNDSKRLKVKMTVSVQLQRTINDTRR